MVNRLDQLKILGRLIQIRVKILGTAFHPHCESRTKGQYGMMMKAFCPGQTDTASPKSSFHAA